MPPPTPLRLYSVEEATKRLEGVAKPDRERMAELHEVMATRGQSYPITLATWYQEFRNPEIKRAAKELWKAIFKEADMKAKAKEKAAKEAAKTVAKKSEYMPTGFSTAEIIARLRAKKIENASKK